MRSLMRPSTSQCAGIGGFSVAATGWAVAIVVCGKRPARVRSAQACGVCAAAAEAMTATNAVITDMRMRGIVLDTAGLRYHNHRLQERALMTQMNRRSFLGYGAAATSAVLTNGLW